jgi:flagellar biosynthesis/type III secretory pathway M-ring protein FliF/YscJ
VILGVYEAILGIVALLGVYVAWALVRLVRLARRRSPQAEAEQAEPPEQDAAPSVPATRSDEPGRVEPVVGLEGFESMVGQARLRFQVEAQETTLAALRVEMAALHEQTQAEIAELREQIDMLRNARNVAPQYGEAVGLAQRGLTSDAIAERCGISVSEAELVAALSRGVTKE